MPLFLENFLRTAKTSGLVPELLLEADPEEELSPLAVGLPHPAKVIAEAKVTKKREILCFTIFIICERARRRNTIMTKKTEH